MARPLVTVLTTPVPGGVRHAYQALRSAVRPLVKPSVPLPAMSAYPGHYSVTRSVVEGLRAIDADFNFNPSRFCDVGSIVYAPANEALAQAIAMKRHGRIRWLVAGPTNVLVPDETAGIIRAPEIDRLIIASDWVRELYASAPLLLPKLRVCPVGVDAAYWRPVRQSRESRALVYWKNGDERFCATVDEVVRRAGLEAIRIRSAHGASALFTSDQLRRELDDAIVAVYLSSFETQGIALAEAWAMDVPTLVWDPKGPAEWRGHVFTSRSSAPYLTPATGRTWTTLAELELVLGEMMRDRTRLAPRAWVLAHMTDAICARALYDILTRDRE
ncbi:MAG TPA: hypothetical protein VL173_15415 [Vicinamibacterales bacterium]|nr:hypothetical protein [Vicinamibacterales bacterium]